MNHTPENRLMAVAGSLQFLEQVQQIARHGRTEDSVLKTAAESLLKLQPDSVVDVFDEVYNIRRGIKIFLQLFENKRKDMDKELLQYFISINHLQRKLSRDPKRIQVIRDGLDEVKRKLQHFPLLHESTIARYADIYTSTVSDLTPRIIVRGEQSYLTGSQYINRIRMLLLAAIRTCVLWKQCGGGPIRLLFERARLVKIAHQTLAQMS